MLYASEQISLTLSGMLIYNQFTDFALELSLLNITFADNLIVKKVKNNKLKTDWVNNVEYIRLMGDRFIKTVHILF